MALFRRKAEPAPAAPPPPAATNHAPAGRKDRPTPTRKSAEAARRQRVTQTLSRKEARQMAARQSRAERMRVVAQRESSAEKALMRDYIDARFNLGEFLLPSVVVILAITFLGAYWPIVTPISTAAMYLFILAVFIDGYLMWRGFKQVLATRMPGTSPKGLLMYGMTRSTQIRRFRMPSPRLKRGEPY